MRRVIVLFVLAVVLAACISSPEFRTVDDGAEAGGGGSPIAVTDPDADLGAVPADDASAVSEDADVDAETTPPDPPPPPPPPPPNMCNTTGAPAGARCCGAGNTPPLCVGLACAHCSDCVTKACGAQNVCCAISPGKSGKYQGMTCAMNGFAGFCP